MVELLDPIELLTKDLKEASTTLSDQEARYLVDSYYLMQDDRKRAHNQVRAMGESIEPHSVILWLATNSQKLENNIKSALGVYAQGKEVGRWSQSIVGIGPVISAGLIANINMDKTPSVSSLWSYAGMGGDDAPKWASRATIQGYARGIQDAVGSPQVAFYRTCLAYNRKPIDVYKQLTEQMIDEQSQIEAFAFCNGDPAILQAMRELYPIHDDNALRYAFDASGIDPDDFYSELFNDWRPNFSEVAAQLSKRPWNASLKTLCWKIGESFVKTCNMVTMTDGPGAGHGATLHESSGETYFVITANLADMIGEHRSARYPLEAIDIPGRKTSQYRLFGDIKYTYDSDYGPLYKQWKVEEEVANERGDFKAQAVAALVAKNYGKDTVARQFYEQGMLPPAQIHARARRKAVKLFLSHWWEVAYECHYHKKPDVKPYVIDRLGHKDYVAPPNWD